MVGILNFFSSALPSRQNTWVAARKKPSNVDFPTPGKIFSASNSEECARNMQKYFLKRGKADDLKKYICSEVPQLEPKDQISLLEKLRIPPLFLGGNRLLSTYYTDLLKQAANDPDLIMHLLTGKHKHLLADLKQVGFDYENPLNEEGQTPLHFACATGNTEMVCWLLSQGVNIESLTKDKYTPLHSAVMNGCHTSASLLIKYGANLNAQSKLLDTPLHMAADRANASLLEMLLQAGASPNIINNEGNSPLHYSFRFAEQEPVLCLLQHGAKTDIENNEGDTPLGLLLEIDHKLLHSLFFAQHPVLESILEGVTTDKLTPVREHVTDIIRESSEFSLEVPFLLGDRRMAHQMAKALTHQEYQVGMQALEKKYEGACFDVLHTALNEINPAHLLEAGDLLALHPPLGMSEKEWQQKLALIDISQLVSIFEQINFTDPNQPGYINQAQCRDSDGNAYSVAELKHKLQILVRDIQHHIPKIGTPSIGSIDPAGDLADIKDEFRDLSSRIDTLHNYLDSNHAAFPIEETLESLLNFQPKNEHPQLIKLREICQGVQALDSWYNRLHSTVRAVLYHLTSKSEMEKTKEGPTPYASTLIELAFAGGLCGTRYMDDACYIYGQLAENQPVFREQILSILHDLHHGIAQSMVNVQHNQNIHILNRVLQIVDENAGISDEAKGQRFYFNDPSVPLQLDEKMVLDQFFLHYDSASVIEAVKGGINGPKAAIEKDLVIDWFKENVPEDWQRAKYSTILEEVAGLDEKAAFSLLEDKHDLLIQKTKPVADQLFIHLIPESDLKTYREIGSRLRHPGLKKENTLQGLQVRYNITLQSGEPLMDQLKTHFLSKSQMEGKYHRILGEVTNDMTESEKVEQIQRKYGITLAKAPSIEQQLEFTRVHAFLEEKVIDQQSGEIKHPAIIYLLEKMNILQKVTKSN